MTHPSRRSRADNRARWRTLLAQYAQSSLSQREFCLEHDVTLSSFTRWRRVFAAESLAVGSAPTERAAPGGFVTVRVEPGSTPPSTSLCVTLTGGVRIENIELSSVPLVAALLAAL